MHFRTTYAQCDTGNTINNARQAARTIKNNLKGFTAGLVIFFAASDYDPHTLAADMHDAFPEAVTMGCTTAGEGIDDMICNASVAAMAFSREVFDYCESALVLDGGKKPKKKDVFADAGPAMDYLGRALDRELIDLDHRQYVGFMLGDCITPFTERVVEIVGEKTNIMLVGGIAGDDYNFDGRQYVFYKGEACRNAAVLCLWKPKRGFSLLKTQAVNLTDTIMVITRADEQNRIIWEFDGQDAAPAYARAINTPLESMGILDFDENPLALIVDGEPYLQAIIKQVEARGLQMYAQVKEGTRRGLTRAGDVCAITRDVMEKALSEAGEVAAILHVNCASRCTALKNQGRIREFGKLFGVAPSISFASYGEIYVGIFAETSTMILFH